MPTKVSNNGLQTEVTPINDHAVEFSIKSIPGQLVISDELKEKLLSVTTSEKERTLLEDIIKRLNKRNVAKKVS